MSGCLSPLELLPRRFTLFPGVASPLICRHPKPLRCRCHAEAAVAATPPGGTPAYPDPDAAAPAKAGSAGASAKAAASATKALQDMEWHFQRLVNRIIEALRAFPEALDAVRTALETAPPPPSPVGCG